VEASLPKTPILWLGSQRDDIIYSNIGILSENWESLFNSLSLSSWIKKEIQRRKERMKEDTDLRTDEASSRDNANCTLSNLLNDDERLEKRNVSVLMMTKKLSKRNVSERKPPPPSTSYFSNL